jgi:hypothetical protein
MERKREESLFKERKLPKSTEESEYQDSWNLKIPK